MSEGLGLASVPLGAGMSEGLRSAVAKLPPATARAVLPASGAPGAALPAACWAVLPLPAPVSVRRSVAARIRSAPCSSDAISRVMRLLHISLCATAFSLVRAARQPAQPSVKPCLSSSTFLRM